MLELWKSLQDLMLRLWNGYALERSYIQSKDYKRYKSMDQEVNSLSNSCWNGQPIKKQNPNMVFDHCLGFGTVSFTLTRHHSSRRPTLDLSEFNVNIMTGNNEAYQHSPYDPVIQKWPFFFVQTPDFFFTSMKLSFASFIMSSIKVKNIFGVWT